MFAQQNEQNGDGLTKQKWGIFLNSGVMTRDHAALSQLIYESKDELGTGCYFNAGAEIRMDWNNVFFIVGAQRSLFSSVSRPNQILEVEDVLAGLSVGYRLNEGRNFSVIPNLGLSYLKSEILFTSSSDTVSSASRYLGASGDTHRLMLDRFYIKAGLAFIYSLDFADGAVLFPLDIGLNVECLQSISLANWKNTADRPLDGPNVFNNSFYVGLTMGWWI